MAATVPQEIYKFNNHCRYLKKLKRQTQSALQEIRTSGKFYSEQVSGVDFTTDESFQLNQIFEYAPCFIVLGQNSYSKSCLVNELFCHPILPLIANAEQVSDWRGVSVQYGVCNQASLILPDSYELAQPLIAHRGNWQTIPQGDLELKDEDHEIDSAENSAILEIKLRHALLKDGTKVIVSPSKFVNGGIEEFIAKCIEEVIPILVYAIADDILSDKDINDLKQCKDSFPNFPVFFIRTPQLPSADLTESEQHFVQTCRDVPPFPVLGQTENLAGSSLNLFQSLCEIGYLSILPTKQNARRVTADLPAESEFVERFENVGSILSFVHQILRSRIIGATTILNEVHNRCLRMFIMSAFDMTRDMLITPRRLEYASEKETELYNTLNNIATHKQDEIRELIVQTITKSKDDLIEKAAIYEFKGIDIPPSGEIKSAWEIKICTGEIQDLILGNLNTTVAKKLINSVEYLKESFVGTLERCIQSLENSCKDDGESPQAGAALAQILNAAYQVEVTIQTSSSFMRVLWEKMKQLVQNMPWKAPPRVDNEWKKKIASDMMNRLSETRLAKSICAQFRDKLKHSHDIFQSSLKQLEAHHTGRLKRTEERRLKVRKQLAPKLAKYALESTSLRDALLYGMPQLGREIGRGQYGVVYSCESWAGYSPCALKSVVPPDEKHWNDLAMEFYYTKSIPAHDHVVAIRGSVIDHSYAGGSSPAVLLIMDRLQRDLHAAIKAGLNWMGRLQVAIDVVQGIRYLHSQGLIHRDVKLKNVLLDKRNRAKITDLGFCKPEAMMSGSIVGTPIHMAPELFSGKYDSTVDVYAFGILFWYICAGHVRLPYVYEQCQNKDQLWTAVKKGSRPERLPHFDSDCWSLMEECWSGNAICRPLLGDVEFRLRKIRERYRLSESPESSHRQEHELSNLEMLSITPYFDADVQFSPN